MKFILPTLLFCLIPVICLANTSDSFTSHYAGQEQRSIKSLSESDIEELSSGQGWGLAKAAELNGMPGPAHLLEMKKEIGLSAEQTKNIEQIFKAMQSQAIPLGTELIELERQLNDRFAARTITEESLRELLEQIAQTRKQLRYVHLSAHLETPGILTAEQIDQYNELRGYSTGDPCQNIPPGHDPEMWKLHNNCP